MTSQQDRSLPFQVLTANGMLNGMPYDRAQEMFANRTALEVLSLLSNYRLILINDGKSHMIAALDYQNAPPLGCTPSDNFAKTTTQVVWAAQACEKLLKTCGYRDAKVQNGRGGLAFDFTPKQDETAEDVKNWFEKMSLDAIVILANARGGVEFIT